MSDHAAPSPHDESADKWLGWAFVAAFGAFAAWGWMADGFNAMSSLLAIVFGLFQVATNFLAIRARDCLLRPSGRAYVTGLGCILFMAVSGLLTHEALTHAYGEALERGYVEGNEALMSALFLFVPFLEPFVFWVERVTRDASALKQVEPSPHRGFDAAVWAAPALAVAVTPSAALDRAPIPTRDAAPHDAPTRAPFIGEASYENWIDRAAAMARANAFRPLKSIAKELNVAPSTFYRKMREHHPDLVQRDVVKTNRAA